MDYCVPRGIPHSKFLQWSEDDQDKALVWTLYQRQLCSGCGTEPSEWLDEDGLPVFPDPYVVDSRRCIGCATLHDTNKQFEKNGSTVGLSLYLIPNPEVI